MSAPIFMVLLARGGEFAGRPAGGGSVEDDIAMAEHAHRELEDVDEALRLIYEEPDRYGVCATCGEPILIDRLRIIPATPYCQRHAPAR